MAKRTITLSADTAGTFLASVRRRRDAPHYLATILIYGTFGSGTVALNLSPNNGATLIPMTDLSGTAITAATNTSLGKLELGNPSTNSDSLKIYAVLTGSTAPTIKIDLYDNN